MLSIAKFFLSVDGISFETIKKSFCRPDDWWTTWFGSHYRGRLMSTLQCPSNIHQLHNKNTLKTSPHKMIPTQFKSCPCFKMYEVAVEYKMVCCNEIGFKRSFHMKVNYVTLGWLSTMHLGESASWWQLIISLKMKVFI